MFQSFEVTSRPEQGPPRLAELRVELMREGLDGFLIPRADVHQGEYVSARDERLAWLTGFTGSAGFCAALINSAGVFIDGRYRTQVKSQVASFTIASVLKVFITSLNFTFGLIVIPPPSIVSALNNAAEIYFPANSPA